MRDSLHHMGGGKESGLGGNGGGRGGGGDKGPLSSGEGERNKKLMVVEVKGGSEQIRRED